MNANLRARADRAREGLARARERGIRIGRPRHQCTEQIKELRRALWTIRAIAEHLECSTATVQKVVNEGKASG